MGFHGKGTVIQLGDAATAEVFTSIVEMAQISFGGPNIPTVEETSHDSDWGAHLGGLPDGGTVSASGNLVPANATQSAAAGLLGLVTGAARNWKIVFSDAASSTITFSAILTSISMDGPVDGKGDISFELKVTGEPTFF